MILKILVTLTDNPKAPGHNLKTPLVGSLASEFLGWSWKTHIGIPTLDIGIPTSEFQCPT